MERGEDLVLLPPRVGSFERERRGAGEGRRKGGAGWSGRNTMMVVKGRSLIVDIVPSNVYFHRRLRIGQQRLRNEGLRIRGRLQLPNYDFGDIQLCRSTRRTPRAQMTECV